MEQAINQATRGDIKGGHLWLAIAVELRTGTLPVEMSGRGKGYEEDPGLPKGPQAMTENERASEAASVFGDPEPPVRVGLTPDGQLAYAYGQRLTFGLDPDEVIVPTPEPAYRRAETEVLERIPGESTPAYEAAGESLEDTRSIPLGIAHPLAESVGPNSTCITQGCGLDVVWIKGIGWTHDVSGHPVSCERAAAVSDAGC